MRETPSKAEIKRFLEAYELLDKFEAQNRSIRGYSAFGPGWTFPDQSVVNVFEWLKEMAE